MWLGIKVAADFRDLGYVTGIKYLDQVESMLKGRYRKQKENSIWSMLSSKSDTISDELKSEEEREWADYSLDNEFSSNPRRKMISTEKSENLISSIKNIEKNESTVIENFLKEGPENRYSIYQDAFSLSKSTIKDKERLSEKILYINTLINLSKDTKYRWYKTDDELHYKEIKEYDEQQNDLKEENVFDFQIEKLKNLEKECIKFYNILFDKEENEEIDKKDQDKMMKKLRLRATDGKFLSAGMYLRKMRKGDQ